MVSSPQITYVYPYYNNPLMLVEQQRIWSEYPAAVRAGIEVIVTDDCSPRAPARLFIRGSRNFQLRLYRILVDIRWNWIAAKNLGAFHADENSWLLLTDIDHAVPPATILRLLKGVDSGEWRRDRYYTFDRVDAPEGTPYKIHPNSYFMHRSLFWKVGGYDEELSGFYGTDGYYRSLLDRTVLGGGVHLNGVNLVRYSREVIPDASTTDFQRKSHIDKDGRKHDIMKKKLRANQPPVVLRFPWERLI